MEIPQSIKGLYSSVEAILGFKLFEINGTPITLYSLALFVLVNLLFLIISKMLSRGVMVRLLSKMNIEPATRFALIRVVHYFTMVTGLIVAFQFMGIDLGGLAVVFGFLSVGIGFGLQNVTSNFVAGLILLFERPIRVGDRVTVGETEGDITAINIRSTTIKTLSNISIIVPNSEFVSSNVTNWSHGDPKIRLEIDIGVSYQSDLDLVLKTLREIADDHKEILSDPEPDVLFPSFGDSAWNLSLRVWLKDPESHHRIRSDVNCEIVRRFRANSIEIPFPQRDLHLRSPLPLPHTSKEAVV